MTVMEYNSPRPSILVVDDAFTNIEILASILEQAYEVNIATSGIKALELLGRITRPDLILLDVMMPGMDGYEVCAALKDKPTLRDVPVIFITAMSDSSSESKALSAGAVDFIHKPINPDVVLARVRLHLGLMQQRRDLEKLNAQLVESLSDVEKARDELKVLVTAMEHSPTGIMITSPQGAIEYVNPFFVKNSGYTLDEVKGQQPSVLTADLKDTNTYRQLWTKALEGDGWSGEVVNQSRQGRMYREEVHVAPVKDDAGNTSHFVAIQLDITARHEAELAVSQARQRELELSAEIQQQLLFGSLPAQLPAYAIACYTEASQVVDGDFYTFTSLGQGSFEVLTGDVMGKGMSAALVGAGVKNAYREVFADLMIQSRDGELPTPAEVINAIHARVSPHLIELGVFVTLSLLRFDPNSHQVTWVNAGHGPSLLATQTGQVQELLGENMPLGVMQDEQYVQHVTPMADQDVLLLFSDGLSEAVNKQDTQFGIERVKQSLQRSVSGQLRAQGILDGLRNDLDQFTHLERLSDDLTVIVIQSSEVH